MFENLSTQMEKGLTIIIPIATIRPIPTPTRPITTRPITILPTTTRPTHPSTLLQWWPPRWCMTPGGQWMSMDWALPHTTTPAAGPGRHMAVDFTSARWAGSIKKRDI